MRAEAALASLKAVVGNLLAEIRVHTSITREEA